MYVSDSGNDRVQKFTGSGSFLTSFGVHGTNAGEFDRPVAIAVDRENTVFVVDHRNHRIQKFRPEAITAVPPGTWGALKRKYASGTR